jgi:hypothetical protein
MLIKINYENKIPGVRAKYFGVKLYSDESIYLKILSQQYIRSKWAISVMNWLWVAIPDRGKIFHFLTRLDLGFLNHKLGRIPLRG